MATTTEVKAPTASAFSDGSLSVISGDTVFIHTSTAGGIPGNESVTFYYDTPALDMVAFILTGNKPIQAISGSANLIAKKGATTALIGVGKYTG